MPPANRVSDTGHYDCNNGHGIEDNDSTDIKKKKKMFSEGSFHFSDDNTSAAFIVSTHIKEEKKKHKFETKLTSYRIFWI